MSIVPATVNVVDYLGERNCFKTMPDESNVRLFYGVELETEINIAMRVARYGCNGMYSNVYKEYLNGILASFDKKAILKPDCAFEIVTVPASLRYHKEQLWNKFFLSYTDSLIKDQSQLGGVGLHIHFSREAVTDLQLAKLLLFINERGNTTFIDNIAGRKQTIMCYRLALGPKDRNVKGVLSEGCYGFRYKKGRAVHIAAKNAGKTVEVRIFQGVPTAKCVFQALEFVDALIVYCHKHGNIAKEINFRSFLNWFETNCMELHYPYLQQNLVGLGYVTTQQELATAQVPY